MELLAPGGDLDSIKAAIIAGADAVYCGIQKFNARNRAANISLEELKGILYLAHKNDCKVFLTLNILVVENEIPDFIKLLNKLVNTGIDGVIIQDLGMMYLISTYFKTLKLHASTQLTTHNPGQIEFLKELEVKRVNLSRELNIDEIRTLSVLSKAHQIQTEVFVHGSYCISFSGLCYMSSLQSGNSGNRGRCSQPCRDKYKTTEVGKNYPLNMKDNSAFFDLKALFEAGVYSLKIEGRIKNYDYVYTVVDSYKKQLESFRHNNKALYKVFNRGFSNAYLKGEIHKDMFIDNPRDNSIEHLSSKNKNITGDELEKKHLEFYAEKEKNKKAINNKIESVSILKPSLKIILSGKDNAPLRIAVKTPDKTFVVESEIKLSKTGVQAIDNEMVLKRFKALNDTEYQIESLDIDLDEKLYIPFKELTSLKKKLLCLLTKRETINEIKLAPIKHVRAEKQNTKLSILINKQEDINMGISSSVDVCFQLPGNMKHELTKWVKLFQENKNLIPWFPSIIIGEDFIAASGFLKLVKPKSIVSNNLGIAFEAFKQGIPWVAGPYLNMVNSYSLLCLKEKFNCSGSFISNELNKSQIYAIKKPVDFTLHFSIYHPIVLMTSRQCFFHQVSGCKKTIMDNSCIKQCARTATIENDKNDVFHLTKTKGNLHEIYNERNYFNPEILNDFPNTFSNLLIDLRDIKTKTKISINKPSLVKIFEDYIIGNQSSKEKLEKFIQFTTGKQYKMGI